MTKHRTKPLQDHRALLGVLSTFRGKKMYLVKGSEYQQSLSVFISVSKPNIKL